ncbi:MAG: hypothetical protein R2706_10355 [Acidimicrobiales bacterium]
MATETKPTRLSTETRNAVIFWWLCGAALWATIRMADHLQGLLIQVSLALFLSFAIEPMVNRLEQRMPWARPQP